MTWPELFAKHGKDFLPFAILHNVPIPKCVLLTPEQQTCNERILRRYRTSCICRSTEDLYKASEEFYEREASSTQHL